MENKNILELIIIFLNVEIISSSDILFKVRFKKNIKNFFLIFKDMITKHLLKCPICKDGFYSEKKKICVNNHYMHSFCLSQFLKYNIGHICPTCRKPILKDNKKVIKKNIKVSSRFLTPTISSINKNKKT